MKMTITELKKDLNKKCPSTKHSYGRCDYFKRALFKFEIENGIYFNRRTFGDLFIYYRKYGVTEKILMKALYECNFTAYRCNNIGNIVFFKFSVPHDRFWSKQASVVEKYKLKHEESKYGKYTPEYLEGLYDSVFSK